MALETGTYISDLVATNPASGDAKSQGDDHLRLIKSTVKATFPNVSGAVTPTHTELNYVDGVTSAIQTQINTKGAHAGQTWTGAHDFTGATVTVPTAAGGDNDTSAASTAFVAAAIAPLATLASPALTGTPTAPTATAGTNTTQIATTAFAQQLAFSAALPAQGGATNAFLRTDGASATWVEQVNASQAEMEAGTEAALRLVSPLRVAQAIAALSPNDVVRVARTGNTILALADIGKFIDITSGTFTQTLTAAATLGDGWYIYYRNSGTGEVTLEPNGAEQIDGLANFIVYPGEARLIQCTGTAFFSIVLTPFMQTYTASGTFTKPPGYSALQGLLWGGGGGGGKSNNSGVNCGGGGGGACVPFSAPSSDVGATAAVTVGSGGAGATVAGNGAAGGNSTLALASKTITAYGGGAGGGDGAAARGGGGGGGAISAGTSGGAADVAGGAPAAAAASNAGFGGGGGGLNVGGFTSAYGGGGGSLIVGGASVFGGGGGGGSGGGTGGSAAGASIIAGNGGAGSETGAGGAGTAPAGGGGATRTGAAAGDGARGELRIWGVV